MPTHLQLVKSTLPAWLIDASPDTHRALRDTAAVPVPWYESARTTQPEVVKALHQAYASHRFDAAQVNELLTKLPSAEDFAEPLLKAAIAERFNLTLDVRAHYLFNGGRMVINTAFTDSSDPAVKINTALRGATSTLLTAALQNFEAREAEPGGMDHESYPGGLYPAHPVYGIGLDGTPLAIAPHEFAALCRELDLGQRYQAQIDAALRVPGQPGDGPGVDVRNAAARLKLFERSAWRLQTHIAYLQGAIDPVAHSTLLDIASTQAFEHCRFLTLFGIEICGAVVITDPRGEGRMIVYLPDDPVAPLKAYPTMHAFADALRQRFKSRRYRTSFARYIRARERNAFFNHLQRSLFPYATLGNGLRQRTFDKDGNLDTDLPPLTQFLFTALHKRKMATLKDDALFHAVPTAVENQKSHDEKVQYFLGAFLETLNVAAFVVPGLGEVMLTVMAVELCNSVYEGFASLAEGEREAAFGYLMDVLDNAAMLALMGAVGGAASGLPAVEAPAVIDSMKPITLADGSTRLWKPDLAPFHHDVILPADLKPNELGLYTFQGKQWLPLDDRLYAVKAPSGDAPHRLAHPSQPDAYEPPLRHNGKGAWLHELDTPAEWEGYTLFRRLGHVAQDVPEQMAQRVMRVSGTHEATLRRSLALSEAPPALLEDTLQRFRLDQALASSPPATRASQFASRYQALQHSEAPLPHLIRRTFNQLPTLVAEELVANATSAELAMMQAQGLLPPRITEEAQAYLRKIRLARAYEGVFLDSVHNPDSEKVKLHSVEALPGWPAEVNISVRDGHFNGPELDSAGPDQAPISKVLIKEGPAYETRDADNGHLHGRDDIYASILHALPDPQRAQLGFPNTGQKADLRVTVRDLPLLPRHKVEAVLQTRPHEPGGRSPMGLAEGRPGQPLTTTGRLILEESLLDKLRILELEGAFQADARLLLNWLTESGLSREAIDAHLNQLLGQQQALQASLDRWALSASELPPMDTARQAGRQRIGEALWQHWRANSLPQLGHRAVALQLDGVILQDFPQQLPDFIYPQVRSLALSDFSPCPPGLSTNLSLMELAAHSVTETGVVRQFLRTFPHVTELRLTGSRAQPFNARQPWTQLVREFFPNITALSVVDMSMLIQTPEMADLRALSQLRRLDLSGNFMTGAADLSGLELDYLGLNRTLHNSSHTTASLLEDSLLDHVREISLRGNRITELPAHVLANAWATGPTTRIDLSDNPLSRAITIEAVLSERPGSRYQFTVQIDPTELQTLTLQRDQLARALDDWGQASGSSTSADAEREALRQETEQSLLNYWRSTCINSRAATLDLEGDISHFPLTLPDFFYERVERLALSRPQGSPAQLDRLFRRFRRLESITLYGHVTPLGGLPPAIREMPYLQYLDLTDQGLLINQTLLDDLAGIPTLRGLALENNPMGTVTNGSVLLRTELNSLSLENTGLTTWPTWVDDLLPRPLQALNLENNQLRAVPDYLAANPRSRDHVTHINLRGNPLPDSLMQSLHVSESYSSSYTFDTDLPEYEGNAPSLSESDISSRSHSSHGSPPADLVATAEPWLSSGDVEQLATRRQVWERLNAQGSNEHLLQLIDHLQGAADYRTATSRATLTERVWTVLDAADQDPELRELLNATAQAPLQQLHNRETCSDGIRLAFNQMEIQAFTQRAINESPGLGRGQQLQRLVRRLFRLEELDRLAIQASGSRDEAEVRLVYRLRLAQALDLPLQPSRMLYETVANVSRKELDTALAKVQSGEHGQAFLRYAANQDFWTTYLRESHAERFKAARQEHEASVLALEDRYPGETQEQLGVRIKALEQQWQEDELNLLMELTRMEENSGGTA